MADETDPAAVVIRPQRLPADLDPVVALHMESARWHAREFPADLQVPDEQGLRDWLTGLPTEPEEPICFLVAELGQRIVGLIDAHIFRPSGGNLNKYAGPVAYIGNLAVTESERRRGIASALMAAVEDWAREHGATSVTLNVHAGNAVAEALYAGRDYRPTDVRLRRDL